MNILRNTLLTSAAVIALAFTSVPLASAVEPVKQEKVQFKLQEHTDIKSVLAPPAAKVSSPKTVSIKFDTPVVSSKPAPVAIIEPAPQPVLAPQAAPTVQAQQSNAQPAPAPAKPAPVAAPLAAPVAPAPTPASGVGAALAASAMSQIGITQDCTRMVENALGSIGIVTGDIGPINFFKYGRVVSDPQPGDLMIQGNAHVAIYVGNGQAVSGGFNNLQTVLHPASYLGGASYVRVG